MSRQSLKSSQDAVASALIPCLFVLELNAGRIHSMNTDGSDRKTIVSGCLVTHLMEGIGTALDVPNVTDFAGSIFAARLDGSGERVFLEAQGNLTGIAYAEIPKDK